MKKAFCVLFSFLLAFATPLFSAADAAGAAPVSWELVQTLPNQTVAGKKCTAMQGMCCDEQYAYAVKICGDNDYAALYRVDLDTGARELLPFYSAPDAQSPVPCTVLAHANDMAAAVIDGETHLFVATSKGVTTFVRLLVRDGGVYYLGGYNAVKPDGTVFGFSAVDFVRSENGRIFLLGKNKYTYYSCVIDAAFGETPPAQPTEVTCPVLFRIDTRNAQFFTEAGDPYRIKNLEGWINQGSAFDTETGMLYVPIWKQYTNDNAILLFDVRGAVTPARLNAKKDADEVIFPCEVSVRVLNAPSDTFELESCDFRMTPDADGKRRLYFNNNSAGKAEGIYKTSIYSGMLPQNTILTEDTVVYKVRYDANGGTGTMDAARHLSGVETNLLALAFTNGRLTFAGWRLERKSDGAVLCVLPNGAAAWCAPDALPAGAAPMLLEDRAAVLDLTAVQGDVITAVAQWEETVPGAVRMGQRFRERVLQWFLTLIRTVENIIGKT